MYLVWQSSIQISPPEKNANRQRTGQECRHSIFSGIRYAYGMKSQNVKKILQSAVNKWYEIMFSLRNWRQGIRFAKRLNRSCGNLQHGVSCLVWGLRKTEQVRGTTTGTLRVTSDHRITSRWNETRHIFGYWSVWGEYYGCTKTTEWCQGALYSRLPIPWLPSILSW